ncbi:hypothetical protein IE81DRAFT_345991 [Ceraceosorus guamensis]|uniref:Uncharacterized protein n=1 Tax=Ceraceosorus guamensis TaxID=1522189 RepID=A0A316W4J1_9BASI|nr:hypothetical protein IE81DRAFT_345991 [Ceraceosorus guamensis]PWN44048.1 hypothetical protein IE81DRAFT_345991 [Ceraceosorus guamensis]
MANTTLYTLAVAIFAPYALRHGLTWLARYRNRGASVPNVATNAVGKTKLLDRSSPSDWMILAITSLTILISLNNLLHIPWDLVALARADAYDPSVTIRANTMGRSLSELRWPYGEAALDAMYGKLGQYESRRLYLRIGAAPLMECRYCTSAREYTGYAMIQTLFFHISRLLVLGLVTCSSTTLQSLDAVLLRLAGSELVLKEVGKDRSMWRKVGIWTIASAVAFESAVMNDYVGEIQKNQGWLNHIHTNLFIARNLLVIALFGLIFLQPSALHPAPITKVQLSMRSIATSLESTLLLTQAQHIGTDVLWRDPGLREIVGGRAAHNPLRRDEEDIREAKASEALPRALVEGHWNTAKTAAQRAWAESEVANAKAEAGQK